MMQRKMQARGTGHRASDRGWQGWGWSTSRWTEFRSRKYVGIRYKLKVLRQRPLLMGGSRRAVNKVIQKAAKSGGVGY